MPNRKRLKNAVARAKRAETECHRLRKLVDSLRVDLRNAYKRAADLNRKWIDELGHEVNAIAAGEEHDNTMPSLTYTDKNIGQLVKLSDEEVAALFIGLMHGMAVAAAQVTDPVPSSRLKCFATHVIIHAAEDYVHTAICDDHEDESAEDATEQVATDGDA